MLTSLFFYTILNDMPVFHLVFHSYGSWMPDHSGGFCDRKLPGTQPPNPRLAEIRGKFMKHESIEKIIKLFKMELRRALEFPPDVKCFARSAGKTKVRDWNHIIEITRRYIPEHGENIWMEGRIKLKLNTT